MDRPTKEVTLRLATLAAVVTALVFAAAADAKLTNVTLSMPAGSPRPHAPWTVTVRVSLRGEPFTRPGYHPTLYLVRKGAIVPAATFRGVAVGPGTFRVSVVFPRPGPWRYVIPDPLDGEWSFDAPRLAG